MKVSAMPRIIICAALAASLAGCAASGKPRLGGSPEVKVINASELPPPERVDVLSSATPYFVGPFDRLVIDVFGIEELTGREFQVDSSGKMSFPLVGILDVNGKTPGEVETELASRLAAAYVRDPQVTVNLKETVSRVVTVEGQVRRPGIYPVIGRMTLMGAIAKAEGTDEFSKLDDVVIFRTVEGQRYAALYNLDAIRHGAYTDPNIYAGDVVMIGESRGRRLFRDILAVMPAMVTPLVIAFDRLSD